MSHLPPITRLQLRWYALRDQRGIKIGQGEVKISSRGAAQ
jgi:hypothetical protein